ncbi:MAG: hypothetical protein QE269_10315 [Fimbriimonas sp.]|nr:hypothetical protein [Fimbriimonas sp.]
MEPEPAKHNSRFTLFHGVIVGVLLIGAYAMIAPVSRSAKPAAKKVVCMSNMKQVATAQLIYSVDYDGAISPYYTFDGAAAQSNWVTATLPYVKNYEILLCSESARSKADPSNSKQEMDYEHFPLILKHEGKDKLIWLDKIASPERSGWMHDPVLKSAKVRDGEEIETNHKQYPNSFSVMFFDSHVKYVPTQKGVGSDAMSTDGVWLK